MSFINTSKPKPQIGVPSLGGLFSSQITPLLTPCLTPNRCSDNARIIFRGYQGPRLGVPVYAEISPNPMGKEGGHIHRARKPCKQKYLLTGSSPRIVSTIYPSPFNLPSIPMHQVSTDVVLVRRCSRILLSGCC